MLLLHHTAFFPLQVNTKKTVTATLKIPAPTTTKNGTRRMYLARATYGIYLKQAHVILKPTNIIQNLSRRISPTAPNEKSAERMSERNRVMSILIVKMGMSNSLIRH